MLPFTTVKVFCKAVCDKLVWPRQQESNLYFTLRRHTFYPLNYGTISFLPKRLLRALLDDLTSSVVTALRANVMIHHCCAAVRAGSESRNRSEIMGPSLVSSLL